MAGVFVSYRREDSAWCAGRLHDSLKRIVSPKNVFVDVESIDGADAFEGAIAKQLALADVVVVLIGRNWPGLDPRTGERRIDQPGDFVRKEVSEALKQEKHVLPVLVDGATLPPAEELPEDLRRLSGRQAEELRYKTFPEDSAKLMASIQKKFRHPWLSKWRSVARPVYGTAVVFFAAVVAYSMGSGWWGSASSDNPFFSAALQRERTQALSDEVQNKVIGVVTETDLKTPIQGAVVTVTRKGKSEQTTTVEDGSYEISIKSLQPEPNDPIVVTAEDAEHDKGTASFRYPDRLRHRLTLKKKQQ